MGNYVTAQDILMESIPEDTPPSRIERRIAKWESIVERVTGNVFYVLSPGELTFYGDDTRIMFFNTPIVAVTSLKINGQATELPTTQYRVFNGKSKPQDHRKNPKIQLIGAGGTSVFTGSSKVFSEGLEQKITATWGYVESDLSTPAAIKESVIELVVRDLQGYQEKQESGGKPVTHVIRRAVDQSSIQHGEVDEIKLLWHMIPTDIASTLMLFRAPWAMR